MMQRPPLINEHAQELARGGDYCGYCGLPKSPYGRCDTCAVATVVLTRRYCVIDGWWLDTHRRCPSGEHLMSGPGDMERYSTIHLCRCVEARAS